MVSLKIKTYPDPTLRKKSVDIGAVGEEERILIARMAEAMRANGGIGLAAPQVGVAKRIIVVDAGEGFFTMINPEITKKNGVSLFEEGCLSLPGKLVRVERPEKISALFTDENNNRNEKSFSGMTAKVIQHEIDHLDGKLIIDYLPWYARLFKVTPGPAKQGSARLMASASA